MICFPVRLRSTKEGAALCGLAGYSRFASDTHWRYIWCTALVESVVVAVVVVVVVGFVLPKGPISLVLEAVAGLVRECVFLVKLLNPLRKISFS